MMKLAAAFLIIAGMSISHAGVKVGKPAPSFEGKTAAGQTIKLDQYKGKMVVLEWFNEGCPFVKKHYGAGAMQATQKKLKGKDLVWLSIVSSGEGKQGHYDAVTAKKAKGTHKANWDQLILDPAGEIGKKYGAKTTPHMYVIDKKGLLAYQGAIDSVPSADPADIKGANNYVVAAVESLRAGKKVKKAKTNPYGCSVKYN